MLEDSVPQAMYVLLPEVLQEMPVRASGLLRQQAGLCVLQQLEDQARWAQVPLNQSINQSISTVEMKAMCLLLSF